MLELKSWLRYSFLRIHLCQNALHAINVFHFPLLDKSKIHPNITLMYSMGKVIFVWIIISFHYCSRQSWKSIIKTQVYQPLLMYSHVWRWFHLKRMSALVSSWSKNVHTVPENFVCSSEERPGDLAVPLCKGIPVVDLQQVDGHDRADSIKQIMIGSQDFGMFQVRCKSLLT